MSTNHHTPIATGAPANASTINNPLGDLDEQITANRNEIVAGRGGRASLNARFAAVEGDVTTLEGEVGAVQTEVTNARGAYDNLASRINALMIMGGAGATTTVSANTNTTIVTVAPGTADGFNVGAPVVYAVNAVAEYNIIAGASGSTITLVYPPSGTIGLGTLISQISQSEYEAALSVPSGGSASPTLSRVIAWANRGVINVKAFGAAGNGLVDDTAAIQAAIDASNVGDIIYFPNGTYLASNVKLKAGRIYQGERAGGTGGATIRMPDGANGTAVLVSEAWWNNNVSFGDPITIRWLTVAGNKANNSSGHGILLQNYRCEIDRVLVLNCAGNGIYFTDTNRAGNQVTTGTAVENRITTCRVTGCDGHGIIAENQSTSQLVTDGWLVDCTVQSVGLDAIRVEASTGWTIQGNHWWTNGRHGIFADFGHNLTIANNYSEGCGNAPDMGAVADIYVNNCINRGAVTITGNRIRSAYNQAGNSYYGIRVEATTQQGNVSITGNSIVGNNATYIGIQLRVASTGGIYASISGNTLDDMSTGMALLIATNGTLRTTISGNQITASDTVYNLLAAGSGLIYTNISGNSHAGYTTLYSRSGGILIDWGGNKDEDGHRVLSGQTAQYSGTKVVTDNTLTTLATISPGLNNTAGMVMVDYTITREAGRGYAVKSGRAAFSYRLNSAGNALTPVVDLYAGTASSQSAGFFSISSASISAALSGTDVLVQITADASGSAESLDMHVAFAITVCSANARSMAFSS